MSDKNKTKKNATQEIAQAQAQATQEIAQAQAQATQEIAQATGTEQTTEQATIIPVEDVKHLDNTNDFRSNIKSLNGMMLTNNLTTETDKNGVVRDTYTIKSDGNEIIIRNQMEVQRLLDFDFFADCDTMSTQGMCITSARISKKTAEKAGYKSVVDMLHAIHPTLSKNTLGKYYRIGKIFGDVDGDGYKWRVGVPTGTSVSNLDVVLTLFDKVDVDKLTDKELSDKFDDFWQEYIVGDKIHLQATQKVLKEEVRNIKNPPIDNKVNKIVVNDNDGDGDGDNNEPKKVDGEVVKQTEQEKRQEEIRHAISVLSTYYENNPDVNKIIMELIKVTQEEQETQEEQKTEEEKK